MIDKINIGTQPNDGTGDTIRTAFDKVNKNYDELSLQKILENDSTAEDISSEIIISTSDGAGIELSDGITLNSSTNIDINNQYTLPNYKGEDGQFLQYDDWTGEMLWADFQNNLLRADSGGFYVPFNPFLSVDAEQGAVTLSFYSFSSTTGQFSFASGFNAEAQGSYDTAIGNTVSTDYRYSESTVIGNNSKVQSNRSVSLGNDNSISESDGSFAFGEGCLIGSRPNRMALGFYPNNFSTTELIKIGIGTSENDKKDAVVVSSEGLISSPTSTLVLQNTATANTLVTKEYVDSVAGGGTLGSIMAVQRGVNIGFQMSTNPNVIRVHHNSATFGLINNPVDSSRTAGNSSFSQGSGRTVASGHSSFAGGMNSETYAAASSSISYGNFAVTRTSNSQAFGERLEVYGPNQMVIGKWNAFDFTSKFVIGNGTSGSRNNIFWVDETGLAYSKGDLSGAGNLALVTKEYATNPETFIEMLENASPTQISEIKSLLGI